MRCNSFFDDSNMHAFTSLPLNELPILTISFSMQVFYEHI